ncbi:hypothetical protein SESBI_30108 [Sesbania bispinosa]|nr:hypothetical protein SESBI_30108 [Sesbania bispinosa]
MFQNLSLRCPRGNFPRIVGFIKNPIWQKALQIVLKRPLKWKPTRESRNFPRGGREHRSDLERNWRRMWYIEADVGEGGGGELVEGVEGEERVWDEEEGKGGAVEEAPEKESDVEGEG